MATRTIPSEAFKTDTSVVFLTTVQRALWQLGMPILDAGAVRKYKQSAKLGMLWRAIRWQLLGMAALVAFECLGRQWSRAALVGGDAMLLATLFGWLVSGSELQWVRTDYDAYREMHEVPRHVSEAASALLCCGISQARIGVEFLKSDPILFVEDADQESSVKRYNLIIW